MNWESICLLILIVIAYSHLLSAIRKKSVCGLVKLHLESREKDKDSGLPNGIDIFTKHCPFIVTPVPGMEYMPADIEGAEIKRVILDEQGLLKVICLLAVSTAENEYQNTCNHLKKEGWYKEVYV